jgi:hypothetical protein
MKWIAGCLVVGLLAGQSLAFGQTGDVNKVLADARAALGGDKKLAAMKTFSATGRQTKVANNASQAPTDCEIAFELPDKYMKKEVLTMMSIGGITRTSGFNGDTPINVVDQPPAMGNMVIRMGPSSGGPGGTQTPEQEQEAQKRMLLSSRQDLAHLALGILAGSLPSYPLQFSYGGQAESPDGKADIVDVKGEGDFAMRLFIDAKTHLPLMLSWMAKEPLVMTQTVGGGPGGPGAAAGPPPAGGHAMVYSSGGALPTTPEEREKAAKEMEAQVKEAEARLRVVEYRLYYGDYQEVDGIMVPFKLQRSMNGKATDETVFEKIKINGKIDAKKFQARHVPGPEA